ncbi:MAG TPA: RNA polymerase sigma factor, partial [Bacteroidia bacterium]|nr:RNA polymerase sigma factor [Bacteroidia bacterium]
MTKYSLMNDQELMFHLQQGEASAFDELYTRYSKRLLGYFIRMLNFDKEKAQDSLHDVFLKIIEKPEQFDRARSFKSWVFTIAYNTCKNHYKHDGVVKEAKDELKHTTDVLDEKFFISMAAKMDAVDFKKALNTELASLPVDKKTTFVLRYQEDYSINEIAEIMECSEGTVKSRIHYTLKILSEKLKVY